MGPVESGIDRSAMRKLKSDFEDLLETAAALRDAAAYSGEGRRYAIVFTELEKAYAYFLVYIYDKRGGGQ